MQDNSISHNLVVRRVGDSYFGFGGQEAWEGDRRDAIIRDQEARKALAARVAASTAPHLVDIAMHSE